MEYISWINVIIMELEQIKAFDLFKIEEMVINKKFLANLYKQDEGTKKTCYLLVKEAVENR